MKKVVPINGNIIVEEHLNIFKERYHKTLDNKLIVIIDNHLKEIWRFVFCVDVQDVVAKLEGEYKIDKDWYIEYDWDEPKLLLSKEYVFIEKPKHKETNSWLIVSMETHNLWWSGVSKEQYFVVEYDNYWERVSGYTMIAPINVRSFTLPLKWKTKTFSYTYKSTVNFLSDEPLLKTENKKWNYILDKYLP